MAYSSFLILCGRYPKIPVLTEAAKLQVQRGYLGVSAQDLTEDLSKAFGIKSNNGAIITNVQKDSPADNAGIKVGDVVIKINSKLIKNAFAMRNAIGLLKLGSVISMEINRKGKVFSTNVKIIAPKVTQRSEIKINPRLEGIVFGEITNPEVKNLKDLNNSELIILTFLAFISIFFGFYPDPLLSTTSSSVDGLIDYFNTNLKTFAASNL